MFFANPAFRSPIPNWLGKKKKLVVSSERRSGSLSVTARWFRPRRKARIHMNARTPGSTSVPVAAGYYVILMMCVGLLLVFQLTRIYLLEQMKNFTRKNKNSKVNHVVKLKTLKNIVWNEKQLYNTNIINVCSLTKQFQNNYFKNLKYSAVKKPSELKLKSEHRLEAHKFSVSLTVQICYCLFVLPFINLLTQKKDDH